MQVGLNDSGDGGFVQSMSNGHGFDPPRGLKLTNRLFDEAVDAIRLPGRAARITAFADVCSCECECAGAGGW